MIGVTVGFMLAATGVVSFKDANKIKSWDAWDDHKAQATVTNILQKEKPCVTWARLNELDFGLREIGRLRTRTSSEIRGSSWSVGCETLDRDYADWDSYKGLLPLLGVKHARFFSGWAKTEQEKGKYDFTWLDPQIRECAAMSIRPWICISYGNPVWGSDFRLGMRVKQVTDDPEAFAAWLRYVKALVGRYKDVVDEWEVWNEPFHQAEEYAELFYRTAKAVREVQPQARIYCTAIAMNADMSKSDYAVVLEKLKRENALGLASRFIYHPYWWIPDESYEPGEGNPCPETAGQLRALVKGYSPAFDIMQGEVGCPGQLEFAHALHSHEWTECSQAKWDLRRAIGDAAREIPSNVFTMIDLQYTFMLQSFGLVRSNALKEFVYRRPKWYAMRNVYALFDDDTKPTGVKTKIPAEIERRADPRDTATRELTRASFVRFGKALHLFWYANTRPSSRLEFDRVTLHVPGRIEEPVWVDMITGRIGAIEPRNVRYEGEETVLTDVPLWDSPVLIATRTTIPLQVRRPVSAVTTWTVDLDRGNVVTNVPLGLGKTSTLTIPRSEFADPHGKKTATLLFDGTWWHLECEGHVDEDSVLEPLDVPAQPFPEGTRHFESAPIASIQGWKPKGHNASVGDVAGIWYEGRLHVFYLADRRNHGSKGGTGGHFFAHLSSADLVSWREHPAAVPITEWWQTVGTGTPFVLKDGRLALAYGFHTERMRSPKAKGKPFGATYAVSDDGGESFRPTGEFFHATRNPTVYNRADGRYGMVCGYGMGGIYASDDLKKWELVDDTTGAKGDCPCYFAWNGHHYLLQGYRGHEYLRHSKTGKPGSWEDWNGQIPALYAGLVVPMVVEIPGNRRLLLGWRPKGGAWGGVMEIREVIQGADGSLRSELWNGRLGK